MTYFEKNLINNLNITQKANDIIGVNTFNPDTIHDLVVKTLISCKINFFEDGEEVTQHIFPKHLQSGSHFYLVYDGGTINEFVLSKIVYRKNDNGQRFPFELYIKDGDDEYSIGWIGWDAYGEYIFSNKEDAERKAKYYLMVYYND